MDVNKGRYEEIFPVVFTVYKSTSPMDFVAVLKFKVYNSSFYSPLRWRCCCIKATLSNFVCESVRLLLGAVPRFAFSLPTWKKYVKKASENL